MLRLTFIYSDRINCQSLVFATFNKLEKVSKSASSFTYLRILFINNQKESYLPGYYTNIFPLTYILLKILKLNEISLTLLIFHLIRHDLFPFPLHTFNNNICPSIPQSLYRLIADFFFAAGTIAIVLAISNIELSVTASNPSLLAFGYAFLWSLSLANTLQV